MTYILRVVFALTFAANVFLGVALYRYASDYASLLMWACEMGNGGYECGED